MSIKQFGKIYLQKFRYLGAKLFPKKTYAQFGEDIKVQELIGTVNSFVDIGANDGYSGSNTFLFAMKGAKGVCFEPVPTIYQMLRSLYQFKREIICFNLGISDASKQTEIVSAGVLSYLPETADESYLKVMDKFLKNKNEKQTIKLAPFAVAMRAAKFVKEIDLLSIDVEGHELQVLKGIDFTQYKFKILVIETHSKVKGEYVWKNNHLNEINALLSKAGYLKVFENELNSFYLPQK